MQTFVVPIEQFFGIVSTMAPETAVAAAPAALWTLLTTPGSFPALVRIDPMRSGFKRARFPNISRSRLSVKLN